ncbi:MULTISPECIES: GAF domain-containing protein [Calothrix]|uniref:histidine kinase n=2 Tax=Calothrix TaxID=1186 RepID=A0ABR8AGI4_9CYAN|nr:MULTISPECIES: GAF domain-containing protein [Calothrix]MBD2198413.1 GAF domain-containing protein [Calothrix parietina FACHB-288]MBD2226815.1 GAF domain-containing protein [Calothrix anomala FACHB-343]
MTPIAKINLQLNLEQEGLLRRITNSIRETLDLEDILTTTTKEVRSLLKTDRVMIYKFHTDGSGQVIAESIYNNRLPSLFGLNFPADDIPPHARELFKNSQVRSVVNVEKQQIGYSHLRHSQTGEQLADDIHYRPVDPCHVQYLTAMGVKSSLVAPIICHAELWGLLVSHHADSHEISADEIDIVQMVVEQLSIAIAQSHLLIQAHNKAEREANINRIAALLHSLPTIVLQPALEATVAALGGSGGRLCIRNNAFNFQNSTFRPFTECLIPGSDCIRLFICGEQPAFKEPTIYPLIEQFNIWQEHYQSGECDVWAISDIYETPNMRTMQLAFQGTKIRSILMIPLNYRQELVGYLSIFRNEIDTETLWAGRFDTDSRQLYPRQSFELWRETKTAQIQKWTDEEIEMSREIGKNFASAIQQYELYQQVQVFNLNLEKQVRRRTIEVHKTAEQQQAVFGVIAKIRESLDIKNIFQITTKEVCQLIKADRVCIYRFDGDWGGEFVGDFEVASPHWSNESKLKVNTVWNDTYLQDTQGGRYRYNETFAVNDIYKMGFTQCHLDNLEEYQIYAFVLAPIFVGQQLWGLLCSYQHSGPRQWQNSEVNFLSQIAAQLGVALQQAELLRRTQEQALDLKQAAEQQRVLFEVVAKIRESLDLEAIFQTTTQEICKALQADRVAVYQFHADWSGEFIAEFVGEGWIKLVSPESKTIWQDSYLQETQGGRYRQNETFAVHDIYRAGHSHCHIELLEQFQIKAYAIAPIFIGQKLWGLLAAYQNSAPRHWEPSEIQFLAQIANQLGVALQQVNLFLQTQQQTQQLTQALYDLQETQTQLIQTEKMSSLGQLVAGIAHEINNPVNFIYGNLVHVSEYADDLLKMLDLYEQELPHPSQKIWQLREEIDLEFINEDLPKTLTSMKVGIDRIRQIVLGLRNFSRLDEAEMKAVNIHEGIDNTLLILQHRLKAKPESPAINIVKNYDELPLVECYAGQLNQVFMNVLSNAIDALEEYRESHPENHQSQITIYTSIGNMKGNMKSVVIRIADNGAGIPEALKTRICDPFFTTKPVGKGTGLGLSISYKIVVEKHGGIFKSDSEPGLGTEFWIEIPIQQNGY